MDDWILECLHWLEVPPRVQGRLFVHLSSLVREHQISDRTLVYRLLIQTLESVTVPHAEKVALRLDGESHLGNRFHELVSCENIQPSDQIQLADLPLEYIPFLNSLLPFIGPVDLDALLTLPLASPFAVHKRISVLRARVHAFRYVYPPERPLKDIHFTADHTLVIILDKAPRGQDPVADYRKYYDGLSPYELQRINPSLYSRIRMHGDLSVLPHRPKNCFDPDPVAYYFQHHLGVPRGSLEHLCPGLYQRLRRDGKLSVVPCLDIETARLRRARVL